MVLLDEHQTLLSGEQKTLSSQLFFRDWTIHAIILAQISFLIFAWTFAGLMIHKTIPLPDSRATWIHSNSSETQVIVTLISTILALSSSFLLSKAVQYALVRRLSYAPLRLHTMVECAKLAQRTISLNFDRSGLSWALLSVAWVSLLSFLTTAWTTLLAPESVVMYYDLQGNETNFLNPSVSNIFADIGTQPPPGFNLTPADTDAYVDVYLGIDLAASLMGAGSSAVSASIDSSDPSTTISPATNFIDIPATLYASNISTGGIFPTGDLSLPPSLGYLGIGDPSYQGLSRTYSATQQGFTANVSCRTPGPNDPVITLNLTNSILISADEYDTWAMDTYSWSTNCSSEVKYSTFGVTVISGMFPGGRNQLTGENGLLMTSVCFGRDFSGSSNQSFLVLLAAPPNSTYTTFNQTCQVTPLVTTVHTTYDQSNIINITGPPLHQHPLPDPTGSNNTSVLLWFPAHAIWTTFVRSQGLTANMMGDKLLVFQQINFTSVTEDYLRGMVEYLGTLMAQLVTADVPPDMTIPSNGTIKAHTFGWTFHLRTHGPSLAAITLVTLLTVAAGVFAMVMPIGPTDKASQSQPRKLQAVPAHLFNPTGTMDVLLASSAGDLARVLSESGGAYRHTSIGGKHDYDRHGVDERLTIVLGMTEEGQPALRTVDVGVDQRGSSVRHDLVVSGLGQDDDGDGSKLSAGHDEEMELAEMRARTGE